MAKKKRRSKGVSFIEKALIIAVSVVLIVFLVTQSQKLENRNKDYVQRLDNLEKDITKEEKRKEELEEMESDIQTPEYAGKIAKDRLGLVGEDEVIFRPEQ